MTAHSVRSTFSILILALGLTLVPTRAAEQVVMDAGARKYGTLFKGPVDDAIRVIRAGAQGDGLGDGSCRQTAMVLCAMGNCHRFYYLADGPYVRSAVRHLFTFRQKDGGFMDAGDVSLAERITTTKWVLDALAAMDPNELRADIEAGERYLEKQSFVVTAGFGARVAAVLDDHARGASDPRGFGERAAVAIGQGGEAAVLVEPLVELVACQVAARRLDSDQDKAAVAAAAWSDVQQKGVDYLMKIQQGGLLPDLGLSALLLGALQTKPAALRNEKEKAAIEQGLQALIAAQADDGSIGDRNTNYTTCAAILALTMAERESFGPIVQKARKYIVGIQNVESRGYARGDRDYGSIGYGGSQRGDLSNLHFAMEAMRAAGAGADDEALQKAIVFLQRTQNLRSVNDYEGRTRDENGEWMDVISGDDGGSAYYPGNSAAGYVTLPDGKKIPRSYGSMTYALLKAYILAGIPKTDPRVLAAVHWIEQNWTLEVNPGADPADPKAPYAGLFYYYMVLAQALEVAGVAELRVPGKGETDEALPVDWRQELRAKLASIQGEDGSWVNAKNGRWWEDQPPLCTIYVLLALHHAR